jgi:S1-C subfamily serine protease
VRIVVLRGEAQLDLFVTAVEQKSEFDSIASMADAEKNLVAELGILGVEIDPRKVTKESGLRDGYGIIVAARAAGARSEVPVVPRDIIRTFNNKMIFTLEQLRSAVRALQPGSPVTLQIQREGRLMYLSFTLD